MRLSHKSDVLSLPHKWESINQFWQWPPVCTEMTILKYFGLTRKPQNKKIKQAPSDSLKLSEG